MKESTMKYLVNAIVNTVIPTAYFHSSVNEDQLT